MSKTFRDVIDELGATEALAADLGVKIDTLRKWRHRKRVPPEYWLPLIQAADRRSIVLTVDDLAAIAADNPRATTAGASA